MITLKYTRACVVRACVSYLQFNPLYFIFHSHVYFFIYWFYQNDLDLLITKSICIYKLLYVFLPLLYIEIYTITFVAIGLDSLLQVFFFLIYSRFQFPNIIVMCKRSQYSVIPLTFIFRYAISKLILLKASPRVVWIRE